MITTTLAPAGFATRHSASNDSSVIERAPARSASLFCWGSSVNEAAVTTGGPARLRTRSAVTAKTLT